MKILYLSNFIYEPQADVFKKNACGFGIMVSDILRSVAKTEDAYLLTRAIHPNMELEGYHVLHHGKKDIICGLSIPGIFRAIKAFFICKQDLKMKLRYMYYVLDTGAVKKAVKRLGPDVVHIHGISFSTKQYIDLLRKMQIPFAVTLHGLIGLDDSVVASKFDKDYEREFLVLSERENIPVTVISSGIKERICKFYGIKGDNIHVVCNGINVSVGTYSEDELAKARENCRISPDDKVMISVGNITKNKNQKQVIEAMNLIDESKRKRMKVIFAGKDCLGGELQALVSEYKLEENFRFLGFVERKELEKLYDISDLNVFTSLNDGFGLPIVEGFLHGVPVVTFDDLDAFCDVYSEGAFAIPADRSDTSVAEMMISALDEKWDNEKIKEAGIRFSLENMAERYIEVYKTAIRERGKNA